MEEENKTNETNFKIINCINEVEILDSANRLKDSGKNYFEAIDIIKESSAEPGLYVEVMRKLLLMSSEHKIHLFAYNGSDINRCGFQFSL